MKKPDFTREEKETVKCPSCGEKWDVQINAEIKMQDPDIEVYIS